MELNLIIFIQWTSKTNSYSLGIILSSISSRQTPNSHPLSSNSDNSSDTSDYDDAVDNFDD